MAGRLYPVLLAVPEAARRLPPRERATYLSSRARKAVHRSAERAGVLLGELVKDPRGVPRPANGLHWSLAHKTDWVAGVVAPHPVGIDLEGVAEHPAALFAKIARPEEWRLAVDEPRVAFARFWTAKEAVLKASGRGIAGLADCRVVGVEGPRRIAIEHAGRRWKVEQILFGRTVAAVTVEDASPDWRVEEENEAPPAP
ncbi:MAG: 4'-phosphopantetheinyl transferase superfamily protein [Desulfobacterales bacterium]